MQCSFCPNPAAHQATGCVYGVRTIACAECVRAFWGWALRHVNKRIKGKPDFYGAAGKFRELGECRRCGLRLHDVSVAGRFTKETMDAIADAHSPKRVAFGHAGHSSGSG